MTTRKTTAPTFSTTTLPAAAEGPIQLHQRQQLVASRLRQPQLGFEQVAIGVQRVQQRVDATLVPHIGQARSILQRRDQPFLLSRISRTF